MKKKKPQVTLAKNDFTVIERKQGKHTYIVVYLKGRRGVFSQTRKTKGITKTSVRKALLKTRIVKLEKIRVSEQAKKEKPIQKRVINLYRVTQAELYESNNYRLGQIRVWVVTYNPKRYTTRILNEIIHSLRTRYRAFRESKTNTIIAREEHIIGKDELIPLDTVFSQNFNQLNTVRQRVNQRKDTIYFQIIGKGFKPPVTGVYS